MRRNIFLALGLFFAAGLAFTQQTITGGLTVATVKLGSSRPEVITQSKFRQQLQQQLAMLEAQTGQPVSIDELGGRERSLDLQIGEILINQAVTRDNVRVNDSELNEKVADYKAQAAPDVPDIQFQAIIQQRFGMGWDAWREALRKQLVQEKYVRQKKQSYFTGMKDPTDAQVQEFYDENATRFTNPQIISFNQIFISTVNLSEAEKQLAKKRAEEALGELRTSQFKDVVQKYTDDTTSRYKGGNAGYWPRTDMRRQNILGKVFYDALFALNLNQTSSVMESRMGYHIIQVTEKIPPKILALADLIFPGESITVREHIRGLLRAQNAQLTFQRALTDLVAELRKEAEVTIYKENLN
jgi:parvulin-like peptidyl-prolyl isomerase